MKIVTAERKEARLKVLSDSIARLDAKIKSNPKHPKTAAYQARLAEYRQSVENLEKFGAETL